MYYIILHIWQKSVNFSLWWSVPTATQQNTKLDQYSPCFLMGSCRVVPFILWLPLFIVVCRNKRKDEIVSIQFGRMISLLVVSTKIGWRRKDKTRLTFFVFMQFGIIIYTNHVVITTIAIYAVASIFLFFYTSFFFVVFAISWPLTMLYMVNTHHSKTIMRNLNHHRAPVRSKVHVFDVNIILFSTLRL